MSKPPRGESKAQRNIRQILLLSLRIRRTLLSAQKLPLIIILIFIDIIPPSTTHTPSNRSLPINRTKSRSGTKRILTLPFPLLLSLTLATTFLPARRVGKDPVRTHSAQTSSEAARHAPGVAGCAKAALGFEVWE